MVISIFSEFKYINIIPSIRAQNTPNDNNQINITTCIPKKHLLKNQLTCVAQVLIATTQWYAPFFYFNALACVIDEDREALCLTSFLELQLPLAENSNLYSYI